MKQTLTLTMPSLVLLAGPSGAGKSRFARRVFKPGMVLGDSTFREMVCDDGLDRSADPLAFEAMRAVARSRLKAGRATVIDSPMLNARERETLVSLAREMHAPCHMLMFDTPRGRCAENLLADGLRVTERALDRQVEQFERLKSDTRARRGLSSSRVLAPDEADAVERAVFVTSTASLIDVIGDVHGCAMELSALLKELGYAPDEQGTFRHPDRRLCVFVGDLMDGPSTLEVLALVGRMVQAGSALIGAVGNHDWRGYRALVQQRPVMNSAALDATRDEIARAERSSPGAQRRAVELIRRLFAHAPANSVFDDGKLIVTHGAILPGMELARTAESRRDPVSSLCMYGQSTGEREADGRPVRTYAWCDEWDASRTVVFGHDVLGFEPKLLGANHNAVALDTGCVQGGRLSALRWPEKVIVAVDAVRTYSDEEERALVGFSPTPLTVSRKPVAELRGLRAELRVLSGGAA